MADETVGTDVASDRRPVVVTHANGSKTFFSGGERARREIEAAFALAAEKRTNGVNTAKPKPVTGPLLIPRIFHYVWLGPNRMPERFETYMNGWQKKHPEWRMMRWSEDNLPRMINQRAFDAVTNWSAKSDILRYEVLLRYGGVYIDTDMECCKSIEPLMGGVEAFAAWQDPHTINIAILGSVPWHPFMADVIGGAEHSLRTLERLPEALRVGPDYVTEVIRARHPEVTLFPTGHFYPYHWTQVERDVKPSDVPSAYGIHHWTLTSVTGKSASVIVPTGGDVLRLRWALEGLYHQRGIQAAWEIIVVNDGKQEADAALKALLQNYEGRLNVKYVFAGMPRKEYTPALARNAGVQAATKELVIFLDEDCVPAPDFVRQHQISQNAGQCAAYGQRWHVSEAKVSEYQGNFDFEALVRDSWHADPIVLPSGLDYERWWTSNASVPRWALQNLGGFDERFHGWGGEDVELAERLGRSGMPFKALETCWVVHLDHPRVPPSDGAASWKAEVRREDRPLIANQENVLLPRRLKSVSHLSEEPR